LLVLEWSLLNEAKASFRSSINFQFISMKKDIHPKYYNNTQVRCACGNTFTVGSTKEFIEIEICSRCHPFYTGKDKIIDKMGRVEKFKKRLAKKEEIERKRK